MSLKIDEHNEKKFVPPKGTVEDVNCSLNLRFGLTSWVGTNTLFENENEWQKTELVPISLPRASIHVKTRNNFCFYNWSLEIISFICFGKQMDRTEIFFEMSKVTFL